MSCRPSSRAGLGARRGSGRPNASSRPSVPPRPSRFPARARSAWPRRAGALSRTGVPSSKPPVTSELWRARRIEREGPRYMATGAVRPYATPEQPSGLVNVTDPDSRLVKGERGFLQGYTAQAAVTAEQLIPDRRGHHRRQRAQFARAVDRPDLLRARASRDKAAARGRARRRRLLEYRADRTGR